MPRPRLKYFICVGFSGKIAVVDGSISSLVLAEAEAIRLRSAYPDARAEFWVSRTSVSPSASWRSIERQLATYGDPPEIFGLSTKLQVKGRPGILNSAIRDRLKGARVDQMIGTLPYTVDEAMDHIAKQFLPGMTWENWGEWHIDHINPRSAFDLRDPKQFNTCMALDNLQPLWAVDNIAKSKEERALATNLRKTPSARNFQ